MSLITWSDKYSVSVKIMDEQHLKLVEIINNLHDSMKQGKGKQELSNVLKELISYTKYHFTTEEKLMKESLFQDFIEHKKEHEAFTDKVIEFETNFNKGTVMITVEVMNFLKKWLVDHIQGSDKKYSTVMRST